MLIALTGGALSPFAFTLALIVVGAAIVVTPEATLLLTAGAGAAYLAAMAFDARTSSGPPSEIALATAGINLIALCLIAYVGHGDRARAAAGARGRQPPGDRGPADRACGRGRTCSPRSTARSTGAGAPAAASAC